MFILCCNNKTVSPKSVDMFIKPPHSEFLIPVVRVGGSIHCTQIGSYEATTLLSLELIVQCNIKHNKIEAEQYTGPKRTKKYMGNTISSCFGSIIICTGDDYLRFSLPLNFGWIISQNTQYLHTQQNTFTDNFTNYGIPLSVSIIMNFL